MSSDLSSGVNINQANQVNVQGDLVGGDKIVGYTVDQVSALLVQISSTFQPKPFTGRSPYIGLDSFDDAHADLFFGREPLVADLLKRVRSTRSIVLTGPSGSGKSSLARAGLIHKLKQGALPGSDEWLYEVLKPGLNPLQELGRVASSFAKTLNAGDDIAAKGKADPTVLSRWTEIALGDNRDRRAVVLVDQFEEIFAGSTDEATRVAFLELISTGATVADGRTLLILALRSDFVPNCARYPHLNDLLNRQFMQVGAMQPDELVRAIAMPALNVGLRVDPALISQIIADMRGEPGALPLMQFTLKDLFDAGQAAGGINALTLADYTDRGGIRKSLVRHADESFAALSPAEQEIAHDEFKHFIQLSGRSQATRRIATYDELSIKNVDPAKIRAVVDKLATARLLTTDEQGTTRTVTLSHEALIDAWPWLRKLVEENREAIAQQNVIADDAAAWEQNGHDPSYLYDGLQLTAVRAQLDANKLKLGEVPQAFIDASIANYNVTQAAARRQQLIQRMLIAAVVAIIAVAGIISFILLQQSRAANAEALTANNNLQIVNGKLVEANASQQISEAKAVTQAAIANMAAQTAVAAVTAAADAADASLAAGVQAVAEQDRANAASAAAQVQKQNVLSAKLAAASLSQLSVNPELSLLLALQAEDAAPQGQTQDGAGTTGQADLALRQAYIAPYARLKLAGHTAAGNTAEYSPDGSLIVSASEDRTAKIWDAQSGQLLQTINGHSAAVKNAHFSPDSRLVVTSGKDDLVLVNDARTDALIARLQMPIADVSNAEFSPDGKWIVTANGDKNARVWDLASQKPIALLSGHSAGISNATFSPDGKLVATSSLDKTAKIWNVSAAVAGSVLNPTAITLGSVPDAVAASAGSTPTPTPTTAGSADVKGHTNILLDVQFSPDEKYVVTSSQDKNAIVWDVATGKLVWVLKGTDKFVRRARFSPNSQLVVTAGGDGTARVYDVATGSTLAVLNGLSDSVQSVEFSPNGNWVVGTSSAGARVWSAKTGSTIAVMAGRGIEANSGHFSRDNRHVLTANKDGIARVWDIGTGMDLSGAKGHARGIARARYSQDGHSVVTASGDNTAKIWDATTGELVRTLEGNTDKVLDAAFSPDGNWVATAGADKIIRLWNLKTNGNPQIVGQHDKSVTGVQFSPDGKWLLSTSDDTTARLWHLNPVAPGPILQGHTGALTSARFSPDSAWIATAGVDNQVRLWKLAGAQDGQALASAFLLDQHRGPVWADEFSPDGSRLVTASGDTTAELWDLAPLSAATPAKPKLIGELRGHTAPVRAVAYSPDGTYIVTTSEDKTARVWDGKTGEHPVILSGHTNWVISAAFSPDSRLVATTSRDGTARLWFAASGTLCEVLPGHTEYVNAAVFSPDSANVLTAGDDKTARIYDTTACDPIQKLRASAQARVLRELTCEEKRQYLDDPIMCPTPTVPPTSTPAPTALPTPTPIATPAP